MVLASPQSEPVKLVCIPAPRILFHPFLSNHSQFHPLFLSCRIQGMRRFHCLWNYVQKGWKGEKINYFFDLRDEQKNLFQIYGFIVNLMICNFVVLFFIMAINYQNIIFLSSQKVISSFKYFEHVATIGQKNS